MDETWVTVLYAIGCIATFVLVTVDGIDNADQEGIDVDFDVFIIVIALVAGFLWPIGLPIAIANHRHQTQRKKD